MTATTVQKALAAGLLALSGSMTLLFGAVAAKDTYQGLRSSVDPAYAEQLMHAQGLYPAKAVTGKLVALTRECDAGGGNCGALQGHLLVDGQAAPVVYTVDPAVAKNAAAVQKNGGSVQLVEDGKTGQVLMQAYFVPSLP